MTRLLYIIASTMDGVGLEIETFYDPAKCLKRMGALVDAPFPKPRTGETPQEYHAAYIQWVQEENDNTCENDIALLVEEIDMVSHEQLVGRAIRQPANPAAAPVDLIHLDLSESQEQLLNALRIWREDRATELGRQPHMLMLNATLVRIAQEKPLTIKELGMINGMGGIRLEKYGNDIIAIVNAFQ